MSRSGSISSTMTLHAPRRSGSAIRSAFTRIWSAFSGFSKIRIRGRRFRDRMVARTYPDLVRRIAEKYEIGSHTMNHQLVWQQNRKAFKEDVSASVSLLEDITGKTGAVFPRTGLFDPQQRSLGFRGYPGVRDRGRLFGVSGASRARRHPLPTVRPCRVLSAMKV